jgi:hypothetical protein
MRKGPSKYLTGSALSSRVAQFGIRSMVRSVQRGTIAFTSADTTKTATITTVDTANTLLTFVGNKTDYAGGGTGNYNPAFCRLALTNATTITSDRQSSTDTATVSYEVIEFWPGVLKQVQRGSINSPAGNATVSTTVSASALAKSSLTYLGITCTTGTNPAQTLNNLALTNTTTVTQNRGDSGGSSATVVNYQLAEFY